MRVKCPHCEAKAVLRSIRPMSRTSVEYYVQCTDVECGHVWAAHFTAAHTIRPSGKPNKAVILPFSPRTMPADRAVPAPANDAAPIEMAEA